MEIPGRGLVLIIVASAMAGGVLEWAVSSRKTIKHSTSISESVDNNITTVIKEDTRADGSSHKETVIVDRSKTERSKEESLVITESKPMPGWHLYAGRNNEETYMLGVQRRIIANIYLGAYADTRASYGVSLGISF